MRVRTASHPPFLDLHHGVRACGRQGEHYRKSEQSGLGVEFEHKERCGVARETWGNKHRFRRRAHLSGAFGML